MTGSTQTRSRTRHKSLESHGALKGARRVVCPADCYVEDTCRRAGFLLVSRGFGGDPLNIIVRPVSRLLGSCFAIRQEAAMGRKVWVPVVSGPLAPYAAGFWSWLASRAYSRSAAAYRLYQVDQLSRWLAREGLGVGV